MAMLAFESFMRISCPAGGASFPPSIGNGHQQVSLCTLDGIISNYYVHFQIIFSEWPTVDVSTENNKKQIE